ncbi:MAG: hypothetical protein GWN99_14515, partial [Gemmatimonadetes bacterium]|nr:hypothetical protein [Gemmatimonadota bacterium]NIS02258.1 hypothetical protein [Gemmatimonadota bacterium]NIT66666.1 hypothetical protein [Gemmatimonadota bacterium]NIU54288.1 hypothetical protein [Gemmatimonadota bacterium]NIV24707.1 hypothetical protein [Gemmatimonadota bacterium]
MRAARTMGAAVAAALALASVAGTPFAPSPDPSIDVTRYVIAVDLQPEV